MYPHKFLCFHSYLGMLQNGLKEAACYRYYKPTTPSLVLEDFGIDTKEYMNIDMSHVPNYSNRRRKAPTRDKFRGSQTSKGKVDITDTTDESTVGTLSSQDNLNTNFNRGNSRVNSDIEGIEERDMESNLLTSAARATIDRRSFRKTNGEQGSPEKHIRFNSDDEDLVSEHTLTEEKTQNNNVRTDSTNLKARELPSIPNETRNDSKRSSRNTEILKNNSSKHSRNTTSKQCNRLSRANLKENQKKMKPDQPRMDYDNISAHSSESVDVNARINAYFDTLAQKNYDSMSSCSVSCDSFDVSSRDEACTSSILSDTGTSSRLSEWSTISSDVSISSRSLDASRDSYDMFPTVKVLEDELLEMIDQELYGPYFDDKRSTISTTHSDSCMSRTSSSSKAMRSSLTSTQSLTDEGTEYESTPVGSVRNSTDSDRESLADKRASSRFSAAEDFVVLPNTPAPTELDIDNFGFPLALFGKVMHLCFHLCEDLLLYQRLSSVAYTKKILFHQSPTRHNEYTVTR